MILFLILSFRRRWSIWNAFENSIKRKHPGFEEEKDEIGLQSLKNSNQEKDETIL